MRAGSALIMAAEPFTQITYRACPPEAPGVAVISLARPDVANAIRRGQLPLISYQDYRIIYRVESRTRINTPTKLALAPMQLPLARPPPAHVPVCKSCIRSS